MILEPKWKSIINQGYCCIIEGQNGYGFYFYETNEMIKPIWKSVKLNYENIILVVEGENGYGLFNSKGIQILEPKWKSIQIMDWVYITEDDLGYTLVNSKGRKVSVGFAKISIDDDIVTVLKDNGTCVRYTKALGKVNEAKKFIFSDFSIIFTKNKLYGVKNKKKELVFLPIYSKYLDCIDVECGVLLDPIKSSIGEYDTENVLIQEIFERI